LFDVKEAQKEHQPFMYLLASASRDSMVLYYKCYYYY